MTRQSSPASATLSGRRRAGSEGMSSECPMHREFAGIPDFTIIRCCHIGDFYVFESGLMDGTLLSVDYIEKAGDEWVDLETMTVWTVADDASLRQQYDRAYDTFVERMRAGDPPRGIGRRR